MIIFSKKNKFFNILFTQIIINNPYWKSAKHILIVNRKILIVKIMKLGFFYLNYYIIPYMCENL